MGASSGSHVMDIRVLPVEIPAEDGAVLRGQQWGNGPDWIILLHEPGAERDLDGWRPLLPAIVTPERTVLTVDLRGHGASDGAWDDTLCGADIAVLLAFARTNGAAWVALAGAGDSATQILEFSSTTPIDASILLSPVFRGGQADALRGRGEAKLFAVGSRSEQLSEEIRKARNRSIGWAMLVSMPTDAQGVDLLTGPYSSQLVERIVSFLAEQRMLARHALPGRRASAS
ncbi:MAG: alpha/beta hydrolase [Thermomicrobiales bacterium]|nr:alpha/beta hydrolase [Thermomicrobiales bacterium]